MDPISSIYLSIILDIGLITNIFIDMVVIVEKNHEKQHEDKIVISGGEDGHIVFRISDGKVTIPNEGDLTIGDD